MDNNVCSRGIIKYKEKTAGRLELLVILTLKKEE